MSVKFKTPEEALQVLAETSEAVKTVAQRQESSEGELREMVEKTRSDMDAVSKALADANRAQVYHGGANASSEVHIPKAYLGNPKKEHRHLVETKATKDSDLARYQSMSDAYVLYRRAAEAMARTDNGESLAALERSPLAKGFRAFHDRIVGKTAMDTTDTSTWTPDSILSSTLIDRVRDEGRIASFFRRVPMDADTWKAPVLTADSTVYLVSENTVDVDTSGWARVTASQATDAAVQLDAVKLGVRIVLSTELLEDLTFDGASWVTSQAATVLAEGIDDAIINGDTASTHQDSTVTAAGDRKKAWLGLRAMALDNSYTTTGTSWGTSGVASDLLIDSRRAMSQYGFRGQVAHIMSYAAFGKLLKDDDIKVVDKFGDMATGVGGAIAQYAGAPIIVTEWMPTTMNDAGAIDGSDTTHTGVLTVNASGFVLGDRRSINVRSSAEIAMEADQVVTVGFWRGDFEDVYPIASNRTVDYIIDIVTA